MTALVEKLKSIVRETNATDIRAAFAADPQRFSRYSATLGDFLFDYSKCAVNDTVTDRASSSLHTTNSPTDTATASNAASVE